MRRIAAVPVLILLLYLPLSAFGWTGAWNNFYPFGDHDCDPIQHGSLVQLIHAGDNGQQDDPIEWINAQPNPQQALNNWLAAGCPPVGDDTLRDEIVFLDYGPGFDGYFGKDISGTMDEWWDPWYTRFFTAAEGEIAEGDWYGEVGDPLDPNNPIYELDLTNYSGGPNIFGNYKIKLEGVCADQEINCIPEPATILVGCLAFLLGFLRRNRP